MEKNPLIELQQFGQSIWLDYIDRALIENGELMRLIEKDHITGLTSNPTIFERAITKSLDYEPAIETLIQRKFFDAKMIYENLAIKDIQNACDLLRPTYEEKNRADGFACLEVSPHLAFDTSGTIEEGQRLFYEVDRPNLMIKVPGTNEGMKAIQTLISEGISVNVTLLFSVDGYENAARAYILGLKERDLKGLSINSVHSVASFFISRIDSKMDPMLEKIIEQEKDPNKIKLAKDLIGSIAVANAKLAYLRYKKIYSEDLTKNLLKKGGYPQRLLWASTSTKNPQYSDVIYVESLIGKNTVNTMPLETLQAFRDHGQAMLSLPNTTDQAQNKINDLTKLGLDFSKSCDELLHEGLKLFTNSFDQLLRAVEKKVIKIKKERML
jgi:transaldolase